MVDMYRACLEKDVVKVYKFYDEEKALWILGRLWCRNVGTHTFVCLGKRANIVVFRERGSNYGRIIIITVPRKLNIDGIVRLVDGYYAFDYGWRIDAIRQGIAMLRDKSLGPEGVVERLEEVDLVINMVGTR